MGFEEEEVQEYQLSLDSGAPQQSLQKLNFLHPARTRPEVLGRFAPECSGNNGPPPDVSPTSSDRVGLGWGAGFH